MLKVNRLRQHYLNQTSSQMVAQAASAIAITFGCLVMLSSLLNLDFKSYPLSMGTITANTALCFILSGVLLWLSTGVREELSQESGDRSQESGGGSQETGVRSQETGVRSQEGGFPASSARIAKICAFTVYTISLLTLSEYVFSWIGIDELVLRLPSYLMTFHPGRMGLNTVLNFILIGRALELLNEPLTNRSSYWYAQILALVAGVISGLAIMGYAYKVEILYRILQQTTPMALHTAVTFIVLCVGILWARTDQGFMRVVMNDTYGGLLAGRLLVATIVVPFVLGWLILQGQRAGLYKPAFALSLLVAVLIISFCVLIWLNAALVEGLSSDRQRADQALRQTEERFRLAVDNIPDIFAIYDEKLRFQFANAEGLRRFHKSLEEIFGRTDEEIFPPYITQAYQATLQKAKETRTAQTKEATFSSSYGRFTALVKFVPILDDLGEIYQILAFAEDITERKRAEETLINQQKWLEDLLNLMPTPLVLIEPGTARVTFANRAADEVAGGKFPLAESIADYHTIYYSTDADGNPIPDEQAPGIRVARGDRLDSFELDWHTPVGIRSLLIFADTLPAMHGHPATCVMVFQDITNLKQVEKALSLGYKRLHLLFNAANDLLSSQQPVALIDSLFRKLSEQIGLDVYFNYLVVENQKTMQLASYSGIAEEFALEFEWLEIGQAVCGTAAEESRPIALENVQESTDPKTDFIRCVGITAYYAYPLMTEGRLLGTLSFGSRSRVKFSQNEIGMMQAVCDQIAIAMERARLIASLQQQTEQLREANRMKDEFLAILSHELRSPLNAILGWSQLLRSRKLDEKKTAQAIETIERNAKAQTQLIGDLLDISRMIRGKLRLNVRPCNLVPVIEAAMETVRLAAEVKKINLKFSLIPTLEPENADLGLEPNHLKSKIQNPKFQVSGDAERLQQVIWNLLSNAIKFTPTGGSVEVQLSKELGTENNSQFPIPHSQFPIPHSQFPIPYAQITVSDTGIGIGADFLPYVFDRFRQADSSSTRPHGGLGLGLAIVRHLVELHGGTVDVESLGVGKGATFTVKLPLVKESRGAGTQGRRGEDNIAPIQPSPTTPIGPDLSGIKVLVVDDEADTRDYLTTVLQQCQAQVKAVASALEALETLEEWKPDVLVSDIAMPEEDGYSLIRKVRRRENGANKASKIPAAALTAYARAEDRTLALQAGFQMHLPKPVEPNELATVVASLARN